jgi:phage baseplate assembly protein W
MAYDIKKISPLDLRKSVSLGVKIPFSEPKAFTPVYTSKEQLKYNIINFLLTDRRERIFNPNFGAGLRRRIFEQISPDTAEEIQLSLVSQLEAYFPNIKVEELRVTGEPNTNILRISFSYSIPNTNENDNILVEVQK